MGGRMRGGTHLRRSANILPHARRGFVGAAACPARTNSIRRNRRGVCLPACRGSLYSEQPARRCLPLHRGAFGRCKPLVPTAPHPSALTGSHLPPGEGYSQKFRAGSSESMAPPTRREAALCKFLRIKFVGVPLPLQAPSLASLKSHFHPQIVSLTFKVPSLFGGADVLIYRHKVRRGRGEPMPGKDLRMSRRHIPVTGL